MCVIVDVLLTIAMIAVAPGAVAEFQIGVGDIGTTTDGAAMIVGCGTFRSAFGKGDRTGLFSGSWFFAGNVIQEGEQIQNIFSCKQQIIQKTNQREQTVGQEGYRIDHIENGDCCHQQIHEA